MLNYTGEAEEAIETLLKEEQVPCNMVWISQLQRDIEAFVSSQGKVSDTFKVTPELIKELEGDLRKHIRESRQELQKHLR